MGDGRFSYKNMDDFECCANCRYLVSFPRNNKYNDNDHLCLITKYFCSGIYKDRKKLKHYTPGGRELNCCYERRREE